MSQKFNARLIDELGVLSAQIAQLKEQADAIKAHFHEQGAGAYEGEFYRVTVSVSNRSTLDLAAVREKLSDQFIRAHTSVAEVVTVKCVARNGAALKVAA